MKTILFKEMSENYKLLNKVVPRDENDFSDPYLVAEFVQRSSFAVYDKYLDQLALLRTTELSKIYEACAMLKGLQGDVGAFLTASREDNSSPQAKENLRARATSLMVVAPKCHELMNAALGVFTESQPFLRAQEADRGSALDAFKNIRTTVLARADEVIE